MLQTAPQAQSLCPETVASEQSQIVTILDDILKLLNKYDKMTLVAIAPEIDMPVSCNLLPAVETMVKLARHEVVSIAAPARMH